MNIPDEAVEAAVKNWSDHQMFSAEAAMRTALESAVPYLMSHEREQTRLAHLDAMVNRESKRAELAAAWDEGYDRAESDHYGTGFWTKRLRGNPYREDA